MLTKNDVHTEKAVPVKLSAAQIELLDFVTEDLEDRIADLKVIFEISIQKDFIENWITANGRQRLYRLIEAMVQATDEIDLFIRKMQKDLSNWDNIPEKTIYLHSNTRYLLTELNQSLIEPLNELMEPLTRSYCLKYMPEDRDPLNTLYTLIKLLYELEKEAAVIQN